MSEINVNPPHIPLPNIAGAGETIEEDKARKRGPYKKTKSDAVVPKPEDIRPFFGTLSMVLEAFHAEPLSETEIDTGISAWFPVWEKYYPVIADKAIFLPAMVWSVSVFIPRGKSLIVGKKSKKIEPESK